MPHRPRTRMCLVALCLAATGSSCATRGDVELLEAQLRDRQDELARLQTEVETVRNDAAIARRDADQLRGQLAANGERVVLPEQADALYRVTDLAFNGFVTAGLDTDGRPGDDAIVTTIVPKDADGSPVKLPGRLEVVLRTADGDPVAEPVDVQKWVFPADQLRERWQQDYLAGGFHLQLPLLGGEGHDKVTLAATLETADGRTFKATHDLELRPGIVPASHTSARPGPGGRPAPGGRPGPDAPPRPTGPTIDLPEFDEPGFDGPEFDGPEIDGGDDPNGNGFDRTRTTRTSDVFREPSYRRYQ